MRITILAGLGGVNIGLACMNASYGNSWVAAYGAAVGALCLCAAVYREPSA